MVLVVSILKLRVSFVGVSAVKEPISITALSIPCAWASITSSGTMTLIQGII